MTDLKEVFISHDIELETETPHFTIILDCTSDAAQSRAEWVRLFSSSALKWSCQNFRTSWLIFIVNNKRCSISRLIFLRSWSKAWSKAIWKPEHESGTVWTSFQRTRLGCIAKQLGSQLHSNFIVICKISCYVSLSNFKAFGSVVEELLPKEVKKFSIAL